MLGQSRERARQRAALGVTVAVHVALILWLQGEPPPRPTREPEEWYAVEVLPEPIPAPSTAATPPPIPDAPAPATSDVAPPSHPVVPTHPLIEATPPRRARPTDPQDDPVTLPAVPADAPPATDTPPAKGALPLLGLRQHSRTGGDMALPTLPAPRHSLAEEPREESIVTEIVDEPRSLSEAGFKPARRDGTRVLKTAAFRAILKPDGRIDFKDVPRSPMQLPGLGEAMRSAAGEELYKKQKKLILDSTYEMRVAMALAFAEANLDKRLNRLYRDLVTLWHDQELSAVDRRRRIFDQWDECEEGFADELPTFVKDVPKDLDDKRKQAGAAARDKIEQFVRKHLPSGSADAYSSDELRRLNAGRHSHERFDPYGT